MQPEPPTPMACCHIHIVVLRGLPHARDTVACERQVARLLGGNLRLHTVLQLQQVDGSSPLFEGFNMFLPTKTSAVPHRNRKEKQRQLQFQCSPVATSVTSASAISELTCCMVLTSREHISSRTLPGHLSGSMPYPRLQDFLRKPIDKNQKERLQKEEEKNVEPSWTLEHVEPC